MIKTSREIINQAMKLSQCQNSRAFDFAFLVSLLNSCYSKIYNDLMGYSNSFMNYFTFTESEAVLPNDCYKVMMVYKGKEENPFILSQSSYNNFIPNTYYIENNTIRIVGKKDSQKVTVKYSCLPITLTAPDNPEKISLSVGIKANTAVQLTDDGFYYVGTDNQNHFYSFENKTDETSSTYPTTNTKFNNYTLSRSGNTVTWNNIDVSAYFIAYDQNTNTQLNISEMVWDNTHIAIRYDNNDLYFMNGDWEKVLVNPYLYKGRYFKINGIYGCYCDDSTGKGFLVRDENNNLLYIDFVPDTVLNYPISVFFDIIEDMMAVQLQALCSIDNDALQTKLTNDEQSFYESLARSQQGIRIKNESNTRFGSGLQW